jgi:hypothetical protein
VSFLKMNKLYEKVIRFVSVCLSTNSDNYCFKLINLLEVREVTNDVSSWQAELKFPFDLELFCYEVLSEAFKNDIKSKELKSLLEVSLQTAKYQMELQPRISPVWTGPNYQNGVIQLNTYDTVMYLIDAAHDEVFIVGYSFSFQHESIQELLRCIERAVERGCRVNVIVNNVEKNFKEILSHWKKESYKLNVFHWIGEEEGVYTSLHAKLIIIDQQKLLLTSANFTYHGYQKNIETGVIIEDHKISRDIWKQYHMLMREKQMKRAY